MKPSFYQPLDITEELIQAKFEYLFLSSSLRSQGAVELENCERYRPPPYARARLSHPTPIKLGKALFLVTKTLNLLTTHSRI